MQLCGFAEELLKLLLIILFVSVHAFLGVLINYHIFELALEFRIVFRSIVELLFLFL